MYDDMDESMINLAIPRQHKSVAESLIAAEEELVRITALPEHWRSDVVVDKVTINHLPSSVTSIGLVLRTNGTWLLDPTIPLDGHVMDSEVIKQFDKTFRSNERRYFIIEVTDSVVYATEYLLSVFIQEYRDARIGIGQDVIVTNRCDGKRYHPHCIDVMLWDTMLLSDETYIVGQCPVCHKPLV